MAQQSTTGFGTANPVGYPSSKKEEKPDLAPSDIQPAGVDEEIDYNSLEEALTS